MYGARLQVIGRGASATANVTQSHYLFFSWRDLGHKYGKIEYLAGKILFAIFGLCLAQLAVILAVLSAVVVRVGNAVSVAVRLVAVDKLAHGYLGAFQFKPVLALFELVSLHQMLERDVFIDQAIEFRAHLPHSLLVECILLFNLLEPKPRLLVEAFA